jgi:hypothetical protein
MSPASNGLTNIPARVCVCVQVADFGLSLSMDPGDTHVSHMHAVSSRKLRQQLCCDGFLLL